MARYHRAGWQRLAIVVSAMSGETNRLVDLLKQVNPRATSRSRAYDMAVAAGEQVSVGLTAEALEAEGIPAEPYLAYQLGIRTDNAHGEAKIHSIQTEMLAACWKRGAVPVIAGFQGVTEDFRITTLGRGGSDTSAVALAAALKAAFCEINTDVEGVFTADPRYVPNARLIEEMDYESALELAALGGKVLHSRCVELAAKHHVALVVRSSFDADDGRSTRIMNFSEESALESPVVSGITVDENVGKVTVKHIPKGQVLTSIFSEVAKLGVNVDIIVHDHQPEGAANRVGFTVRREDMDLAIEAVERVRRLPGNAEMEIATQASLAKVSAVGLGMRSHSGVALKMFETLHEAGVEILMISTSEIKISCVVPLADGKRAASLLHQAFLP